MFIHHFNRLIRNKWIWGAFAILISAFFALDFLFTGDRGRGPSDAEAGRLGPDGVKLERFHAYEADVRGYGRMRRDGLPQTEVCKEAWENIAATRVAEKLGLGADKEAMKDFIRGLPLFRGPGGGFDFTTYQQRLMEYGLNPELFEQMRLRAMPVENVSRALTSAAGWVSPMELDRATDDMTDVFTVRVATFSDKAKAPELDDAGLQKYYESHTNSLALPDLVSVRYVKFGIDDPERYGKMEVTDDELHDYYDTVSSRYETQTTNGVERKSFDEVKSELTKELQQLALLDAYITNLPFRVYGQEGEQAAEGQKLPSKLDQIAAEEKLTVKTSPRFGADGERVVPDLMVSARSFAPGTEDFAATAFELDPDNEELRYGVVRGTNCVYLIERASFVKRHVPTFEEAKAAIRRPAVAAAKSDAFKASVEKVAEAARAALAEGKPFDQSLFGDANVSTSLTFSASTMSYGAFPDAGVVSSAARKLDKGALSEFTSVGSTRAVLVYVEDRKPGDAASAQLFGSQVRDQLAMRAYGDLVEKWREWNLARTGFEPAAGYETTAPADVEDEAEDDAGAVPEE